jgi:hypothetical protein
MLKQFVYNRFVLSFPAAPTQLLDYVLNWWKSISKFKALPHGSFFPERFFFESSDSTCANTCGCKKGNPIRKL